MTNNHSAGDPPHFSYEPSLLLLIDLQCRLRRLYVLRRPSIPRHASHTW
jgi:hypothetical protein